MSTAVLLTQQVTLSTYIPSLGPRCGDLILIEHPPRHPQLNPLYELFVDDAPCQAFPASRDLLVLPFEDWITFEKHRISDTPASRLDLSSRTRLHVPHHRTVDAGTTITLRPSNKTIRDSVFGGRCPYERCNHGVILVVESTCEDLNLRAGSRNAQLTVCPFCLGMELLKRHEALVEAVANAPGIETAVQRLLRDVMIRVHRQDLDDRRLEMGYAALPDDPGLYGLDSRTGTGGESGMEATVTYLSAVTVAHPAPAAATRPLPARPPPTRAALRRSNRRGGSRGHIQYRRLGLDLRPGSARTQAVNLGTDETHLTEATLRIQDYHQTLLGPRTPPLELREGEDEDEEDAGPGAVAVEVTASGVVALHEGFMRNLHGPSAYTHRPSMYSPEPLPGTPTLPPRPSADTYGNAICTERFQWYKLVAERVINAVCPICLEDFEEGCMLITSLPCGHFFHEECIRGRKRDQMTVNCPFRCVGLVHM